MPRGFDRRRIPGLLQERREWIERAGRDVQARCRRLMERPACLPERIALPALGEEWTVEYRLPASARDSSPSAGRSRDTGWSSAGTKAILTRVARPCSVGSVAGPDGG